MAIEKSIDADAIRHELDTLGNAWADTHAAASLLEETEKSVLAELTVKLRPFAKSHAEAETTARASPEYRDHVTKMVEARRVANRARVQFEDMKAWVELKRTAAATDRALMQIR